MNVDDSLTKDGFLGGKLQIWQPRTGYRAGTDAVFLAAAVDAKPRQSILDVGCGVGVVSLCLARRLGSLEICGVEVQANYASLARRNAKENRIEIEVTEGDLSSLPDVLRQRRFDHVVTNPPYFDPSDHTPPSDGGRKVAHVGTGLDLAEWIRMCGKRVAPKGSLTLINKAAVLPEIIRALGAGFGSVEIFPLVARAGQPAGRVIVTAIAGSRGQASLHSPIVLHDGETHTNDEDYSIKSKSILRDAAGLR